MRLLYAPFLFDGASNRPRGGRNETSCRTDCVTRSDRFIVGSGGGKNVSGSNALPMLALDDVRMVAPALEKYAQGPLGDLWKRPDLTPRERSMVTLAALIARDQTIEMPHYFDLALDNGVKPREISEIITHLAFYSGWANAMAAVAVAKVSFAQRGIEPDQLPAATPPLLPLEEAAEAQRAARVEQQFGSVVPGIVQYTTDVLFRDLWLRPDLAPRDRSLVTVSALIASGQVAQIPYHLNRAMDNGLTQAQAAEVITHLAFYVGWPSAFSALPVAKEVFEKASEIAGPAAALGLRTSGSLSHSISVLGPHDTLAMLRN
jgi:4-carboxymuconolactone decarboxylase